MLGHAMFRHLSSRFPETYATIRQDRARVDTHTFLKSDTVIDRVDLLDFAALTEVLHTVHPDVVLNCVAITKRHEDLRDHVPIITLNALLPHWLARWCRGNRSRLLTFSTDCVFDGKDGNYDDNSFTNAVDLYGRTKALGEVRGERALTLRAPFIGTELGSGTELLEWFLSQTGAVHGFTNAIYSGVTTLELCRVVESMLVAHPDACGIYNVSSEPISKYALLVLIRDTMQMETRILPDNGPTCNRSLDSRHFRTAFGYSPPSWAEMIEELGTFCRHRATLTNGNPGLQNAPVNRSSDRANQ